MIIFMGVAGSGKSKQGRLLADQKGYPWLSTGEFLRMLISGEKRKEMTQGKLLSDEEIISLVQKIFNVVDIEHEFIMDGFPRSEGQADWLLNQEKYGQLDITAIIHLTASEQVVRERLLKRGRVDDNDEAIAERFREFEGTIKKILNQFKEAGIKVYDIDGGRSVQEVHRDILEKLELN